MQAFQLYLALFLTVASIHTVYQVWAVPVPVSGLNLIFGPSLRLSLVNEYLFMQLGVILSQPVTVFLAIVADCVSASLVLDLLGVFPAVLFAVHPLLNFATACEPLEAVNTMLLVVLLWALQRGRAKAALASLTAMGVLDPLRPAFAFAPVVGRALGRKTAWLIVVSSICMVFTDSGYNALVSRVTLSDFSINAGIWWPIAQLAPVEFRSLFGLVSYLIIPMHMPLLFRAIPDKRRLTLATWTLYALWSPRISVQAMTVASVVLGAEAWRQTRRWILGSQISQCLMVVMCHMWLSQKGGNMNFYLGPVVANQICLVMTLATAVFPEKHPAEQKTEKTD